MSRRSHGSGCECSTCCKPEKPCCKPEKPCCKAKKPCCCIPGPVGPVGPVGPRGGRGVKGDPGTPGGGGGGPSSIVRTFAIDGGNPGVVPTPDGRPPGFPADGVERDVLALPFVLPPGTSGTIDVVGSYSFHALDVDPLDAAFPDAGFALKLDPGNVMLGRSHESAQPNRSGSGALRRRLTGLAPGNYTIRLTVIVASNPGASVSIPGPPESGNDYASIYVQEIA